MNPGETTQGHDIGVAVGYLYHSPSGKVLLHLRTDDAEHEPGVWAAFGGRSDPDEGDDLLRTFCREMQEELGVTLDPAGVTTLRRRMTDSGTRWQHFSYDWPTLSDEFELTEGVMYAWFSLDEAFALPNVATYLHDDLRLLRETTTGDGA